jgi:hypothetical protein
MPPRASTTSTSTSSTAQPCKPITRPSLPPKAIIGREGQGPRRARRLGLFSLFFDQLVGPARAIAAARGFNRSWRREGVLWPVSEGPPFASEQVRTHDHGLPRRWRQARLQPGWSLRPADRRKRGGATACRIRDLPTQGPSASTVLRLRFDARRPAPAAIEMSPLRSPAARRSDGKSDRGGAVATPALHRHSRVEIEDYVAANPAACLPLRCGA